MQWTPPRKQGDSYFWKFKRPLVDTLKIPFPEEAEKNAAKKKTDEKKNIEDAFGTGDAAQWDTLSDEIKETKLLNFIQRYHKLKEKLITANKLIEKNYTVKTKQAEVQFPTALCAWYRDTELGGLAAPSDNCQARQVQGESVGGFTPPGPYRHK